MICVRAGSVCAERLNRRAQCYPRRRNEVTRRLIDLHHQTFMHLQQHTPFPMTVAGPAMEVQPVTTTIPRRNR